MKKILIVSTVSRQFHLFERGNFEILKSLGYEVHGAANFDDANTRLDELEFTRHHFDIQRSPFSFANFKAYRQLKEIMKSEVFDAVHCHSPMGGILARLAAKSVGIKTIIYTAHGFHFYKGAPLLNWVLYYNIEKILSYFTNIIITINNEDYAIAKSFNSKFVKFVPGIGVDLNRFEGRSNVREKLRDELGIKNETTVLLTIGELIKRKNHEAILKALTLIKSGNYVLLICGRGELQDYLERFVHSHNLSSKVRFLGFRNDIPSICLSSDIFLFPSLQEGLPVSMMEAMAAGLPIVASKIRGNTDLIEDGNGGFLHIPSDIHSIAKSIETLIGDSDLRANMGSRNKNEVKKYDKEVVKEIMRDIYKCI